jgi:alkylation response protein AidB-like acyl-CoA dehydrogenase
MDFRFTPEQEAFRQEIRDFVRAALPESPTMPEDAWIIGFDRDFSKKLAAQGWIGLTWPREYGGQGRTYLERLILTEELLRHGAPVAAHWLGDRQMGPSILRYGTPEQKAKFLPGIISARLYPITQQQSASVKRSSNARGILIRAVSWWDVEKWMCSHKCRRTQAIASENVGRVLSYQAVLRTQVSPFSISRGAGRVMTA